MVWVWKNVNAYLMENRIAISLLDSKLNEKSPFRRMLLLIAKMVICYKILQKSQKYSFKNALHFGYKQKPLLTTLRHLLRKKHNYMII